MAHPYHHARSSANRFGGQAEDYLAVHNWFDATKAHLADARHRTLRHQCLGIFLAEAKFGVTLMTASGHRVPVRAVAEVHVQEDFSFIPSVQGCFGNLPLAAWLGANYDGDTPTRHARRSAAVFGGTPDDYLPVHALLECGRLHLPGARHRVLLHTTLGVQTAEEVIGLDIPTRDGLVPTREVTDAIH